MASLVRTGQPQDDIEDLRSQLTELEGNLSERIAGLARAKSDLAAFRLRYRRDVGLLHEELDELERAIAEAELGEFAKRLQDDAGGEETAPGAAEPQSAPRFTSDAVRRLFRDVARTIHPDLAGDDVARGRRHMLMVEANRAYALGDEEQLRRILDVWEKSPDAVQGSDPEAIRERLVRRIAQIEEQLLVCGGELTDLQDTPLWKLKAMVDEAEGQGQDLVADMVRRLKRDIMAARNRLDAMQWNP